MNKYIFSVLLLTVSLFAFSQGISDSKRTSESFKINIINSTIQKIKLANGLTVYLNPDSKMQDVYGAVVVKGGAKYDPKGGTGVAHYFEHIMFKGSKVLGTIDYKSEKVYLDSIRSAYDLLALSKDDPAFHADIIKNIDHLSQKASEYAIPNEFSKVLSSIGGTKINAYTSYENIVYYNHFPKESLEKWIILQVDRFSNPVFRLFQTELETVYEEKNMSMDNMIHNVFEEVYQNFYPNSVYGKQTILGSIEDLKYPSITAMERYFKEYYTANNMALVLSGNFDDEMLIQLLENSFATWREGDIPAPMNSQEKSFQGRVEVKKKMTPISMGILGFRTVPKGHPDEMALEVINDLLSNNQSTGLLDELVANNEIMEAGTFADSHYDIGGNFIYFIPKLFSQSLKNAEKLVLSKLDSLKEGRFSNSLLIAIITTKRKNLHMNLEHPEYRSQLIIDAYMSGQDVDQVFILIDQLEELDVDAIKRIAKKYYGGDYLAFMSKMGRNKSPKLEKPNFTPLSPKNKNSSSILAKELKGLEYTDVKPNFLHFESDFRMSEIQNNLILYSSSNPMNSVYSIYLNIGIGTYLKPDLEFLASYLNRVGTTNSKFTPFRIQLQARGTSIHTTVNNSYLQFHMTGFDENIEQDLKDLKELIVNTEQNETILKQFVEAEKLNYKVISKDAKQQSKILSSYALYGENSPYLKKMGVKEIKELDIANINQMLKEILRYEAQIHYVGNTETEQLKSLMYSFNPLSSDLRRSKSPIDPVFQNIKENHVYFVNNKKVIQSQICFSTPSKSANKAERIYTKTFNRYFGLGMNSIVFREIREFRSLAYGTYAYIQMPFNFKNQTLVKAFMSTQADKTNQGIQVMQSLMDSLPIVEEDIDPLRQSMLSSINSQLPGFRQNSQLVAYWIRQGYNQDPRIEEYNEINMLGSDDLTRFYNSFVGGRSYNISVVGNSKRIDMVKLSSLGLFSKLKLKDIYNK